MKEVSFGQVKGTTCSRQKKIKTWLSQAGCADLEYETEVRCPTSVPLEPHPSLYDSSY